MLTLSPCSTFLKPPEVRDVRFEFGTEYSSSFGKFAEAAYNYQPLPATHLEKDHRSVGKHLQNRTVLFPSLTSSPAVVKGKLAPVISKLLQNLQVSGCCSCWPDL